MNDSITLKKVTMSRDELGAIAEDERQLLIQFGNIGNALNILYKYLIPTLSPLPVDDPEHFATTTKSAYLLRIIAGTTYTAYESMRRDFNGSVSKRWASDMPDELRDLQRAINRYFSHSDNVVKMIRDQFAFHCDPLDIDEAVAAVTDPFDIYFAESSANCLYFGPHFVSMVAMLKQAGPKCATLPQSLDRAIRELVEVTGWFIKLINLVVHEIFLRNGFLEQGIDLEELVVEGAPEASAVQCAYFVTRSSPGNAT